jgi:hypothetical protein
MPTVVAITIEGVLQQVVGDAPIPTGKHLYEGLSNVAGIALITDQDPEVVNRWLGLNGFDKHAFIVPRDVIDPEDLAERRALQVRRLRSYGADVGLVIDSDPMAVRALFRDGVAASLYLSPVYSRPEHRPDYDGEVRPWDDLVAEIERARELRASDDRPRKEAL